MTQYFFGYFLRSANEQGACRSGLCFKLGPGDGRPAAFTAYFSKSFGISGKVFIHCLLFVFGYAVPIYLLLYVDSCSQWTAFE